MPIVRRPPTLPSWPWWLMTVLASAIALYGLAYVAIGQRMYPPPLAASFLARPWGINPHALAGALALTLGALQFHRGIRLVRPALHRRLGKIYVVACLAVGIAGLYMSFYADGGVPAQLGFGVLAVVLLLTTVRAYALIRRRRIELHREWMLRSYALIFAAVTLRIELPLLSILMDGETAYQIVAWMCWVPNLAVASVYVQRTRGASLVTAGLGKL